MFQYFYCENGQPLYVPKSSRFDGRDDCSDLSDECPTKQLEVAFASHTDLIASPFFRIMVWLMATVSTIGKWNIQIRRVFLRLVRVQYKKKICREKNLIRRQQLPHHMLVQLQV